ncbi:MAG TPA: DUF6491 family protein [Caulobacteraceae bacterium]|jgi:hypothetical protein|nr:DUF6491 family protein [Caulobacteraceae bacterium]
MLRGLLGLAAAAALAAGLPAVAEAQGCFYPNQWTSWKAPDDHTIFLKVGQRVFRLDIAGSCPSLHTGARLITRTDATQLCRPVDWDLRVSDGGVASRCIVSNMTQLTSGQIAALPPDARP